ncbi:MAG: ABC transporter substrate-binding protein, partial [Desulfobacterales bacterium]
MTTFKKVRYVWVLITVLMFLSSPAISFSEPIKIGAMFISSGKMGGYGKHGGQAIQLAVDEINADGGVLDRNLEAVIEDTKLKKDIALALAERFVNQDKVDFLMGPTSSGIAMGLTEFARQNKKILVLTQAATDALTGAKFHPYVFSTLSNAMMHS